jgi:hypothetical protein
MDLEAVFKKREEKRGVASFRNQIGVQPGSNEETTQAVVGMPGAETQV